MKVDILPRGTRLGGETPEERLVLVLAGAPAELRPLLDHAYSAQDGVRVSMRTGPTLRFGAPRRVAAKWAAVSRVLADATSGGASLLDVRLPERPAASFDGDPDPAEAAAPTAGADTAPVTGATGTTGTTGVQPGPARRGDLCARGGAASTLSRGFKPSSAGQAQAGRGPEGCCNSRTTRPNSCRTLHGWGISPIVPNPDAYGSAAERSTVSRE